MLGLKSFHRPTIYALSTPLARSAIGVIRISGSQSSYIFNQLTKSHPKHRITSVRKLISPKSGILLDEALTIFFKGPHSYTGEDLLELHVHGGVAIIKNILNEIKQLHNPDDDILIRYAENGEFSHRSFLNGRFDLTELEGIREMIDAETETQRISSLTSMTGKSKQIFNQWRQELLQNIALLTTVIDFGEDHDIEEISLLFEQVNDNLKKLHTEVHGFLKRVQNAEILLNGIKVTLLGPPNAGKSSLLNTIANKDAAIVSSIAGTTRDAIDIPLDVNGYKVVVGDTAGLRDVNLADEIEVEGIKRAKAKSVESDLVLVTLPTDYSFDDNEFIQHIKHLQSLEGPQIVGILNKEDLVTSEHKNEVISKFQDVFGCPVFTISCKTGSGTNELIDELTHIFQRISNTEKLPPILISDRAKDILINDVVYGIDQFAQFKDDDDIVLATESLRQAVEGIGKITGEAIGIEEILGVVFSSFCIGK